MAKKPFEIQDSTLRMGGVDLQAGTTGVVIPGVTQATNYRVEEVEDTDADQTYQFAPDSAVVVIDKALYDAIVAQGNVSTFADFSVELDDDGYIDDIEVNGRGTYSAANADRAGLNDMYAYVGAGSASDRPLVPEDWITIPFRPKMRPNAIQNVGGGSGGAIVEREVSFPTGDEGDQRGTIALTPDGETYVCTDDWVDTSESLQGTFTAVTNVLYDINQSGGGFNSASLSIQDEPEIYNILRYGNWNPGELTIDAGPTWGGVQNVDSTGYNDQAGYMTLLWIYRQGDPQEIPQGTSVTITYTGSGNQTPIWRRLVDLTAQGGGEDGEINWRSNGDLTIETIRTNGYTGDCDLNLYGADDVWIEAKGDEAQIRAVNQVSIQVQGDGNWIFQQDGSIALPNLENTGYQSGYSLNGPTLMLGGELNNPPEQVIITGPRPNNTNPSAERLIIQGQRGWGGENQNVGEGGDIYIWAGVGGDGGSIDPIGNGGDIKVRGGQGGTEGGYVRIEGGDATADSGQGGFIDINAGDAGGPTASGGDVNIRAGSGGLNNGEVNIYTESNTNHWIFKNDGALQLPVGGDIRDSNGVSVLGGAGSGAELVGDGDVSATGAKVVVNTNYNGYQGGETTSLLFNISSLNGYTFSVGDTITFRNGEVRTITSYDDTYSDNTQVAVGWVGDVDGNDNNPRYPITITTQNYVPEVKKTARIKPDEYLVGSGQYMDVYAGGPTVLDKKHIHMAGHAADTELFLGTDNNFVSSKEAGLSPARVNLKSENDITVSDTNLRLSQGNTWISVYGEGVNRNFYNNTADLTWNVIESDDQGNFYVGGEHTSNPDAMVAKYGPDGDLIWKRIVDNDNFSGWGPDGVAYNPVDKEVAYSVRTSYNRSNDYAKVSVFDSETGDLKTTFDVYDGDGQVLVSNMTWHPTLGYVVVGWTAGEVANTMAIEAIGATGTGIIELPAASVKINGSFPVKNSTWRISGTNITGTQTLQSGVGLYYAPVINLTNPGSTGMTAGISVVYNGNYYENTTSGTPGTGTWDYNDSFKILGSNLGGIDGDTTVIASPNSLTPHDGIVSVYFTKTSYPDLYKQLQACSWTAGYNSGGPYNIIAVADAGANWQVDINSVDTTLDAVSFYTASGNDITGLIADANGIQNGYTGTPNLYGNYRIDMGFSMGYGSTDFTGGSFTISTTLDNRGFVWTNSWNRFYNPVNGTSTSRIDSVAVDKYSGGLVVGGMDDTSNKGFVWKLQADGDTDWVKAFDDDQGNRVSSVAVSTVNGSIYFTTDYKSINCFSANGSLVKRSEPQGMWGHNGPLVKLEQELDGEEYLYVGSTFGAIWTANTGYLVQKLTTNFDIVWSRDLWNSNSGLDKQYDNFHNHFVLGRGKAVMVGYSYYGSYNNYNGYLVSISTTDNFETGEFGSWLVESRGDLAYQDYTGDYSTYDLITNGGSTANGSLQTELDTSSFSWTKWFWRSSVLMLSNNDKGVVGVENISFVEGGKLDHNPADIPQVLTNFDGDGWNYTLKLSDRGKFITNGPEMGDTNNLYITVPTNHNVMFPVGSIITLINLSNADTRIYVQPQNWGNSDAPRIFITSGSYSTWSFQGIQTATLMKIGSNDWLLTANNISNED